MALLEVEDLRTVFHTQAGPLTAVDGVSFSLERGEVLGLVGESGSGKSVTALSVLKLVAPPGEVSGKAVRLDGEDLLGAKDAAMRRIRGRRISMVFQEPLSSLNPVYTVGSQVMEPLKLHTDLSRDAARKRATEMLGLVGIPEPEARFSAYPHQLSGGLRQRVMIAIALVCEPDILIADEPTTALDVTIQAQILRLLKDLQGKLGMAVVMITHDLGVIAEVADRVNVMYAGQIVETADVQTIFSTPRHPYTAALIDSIPDLTVERPRLAAIDGTVPDPGAMPPGCRFAPRCRFRASVCDEMAQRLAPVGDHQSVACIRSERGDLPADLGAGGGVAHG